MTDTSRLSRLQREILRLAHDKRQAREAVNTVADRPQSQPFRLMHASVDLFYAEILAHVFGFPPLRTWVGGFRTGLGDQHFSRTEVGPPRYDAAQASISRAVRRLEARGLVTVQCGAHSRWTGLTLTDEAVNTAENYRSHNRFGSTPDGAL